MKAYPASVAGTAKPIRVGADGRNAKRRGGEEEGGAVGIEVVRRAVKLSVPSNASYVMVHL